MGQAARQATRQELLPELAAVGESLVSTVREQVPAYRQLQSGQLAEVQAIAHWALGRIVELWVQGGSLDGADLARFRAIGAARARDGRPLAAVLRGYRVAAGQAIEVVVRRGGARLDTEDVLALTRLWLVSADELSEALFTGYTAAAQLLTGDRRRALRDLLDDLLVGRQASPGALADRFAHLAVPMPARPALLLAQPVDPDTQLTDADGADLSAALGVADTGADPTGHLVTVRGPRVVLLGPAPPRGVLHRALADRAWRGCLVGTGAPADTPAAFRLATDALDAAPAHAFDAGPLLDDGDAQVLALLGARPNAAPQRVVAAVLGPLTEPGQPHLLAGLDAFLATGSAAAAAQYLHLHPQTMRYRLRRVRELTGRDPRLPWHRLVLDIARHLSHRQ